MSVNGLFEFNKEKIPFALWLILILFFIKCTVLAFSITPLWDIPDESAHYSYIQDIAMGNGLPVLGETPIAQNVMESWRFDRNIIEMNWIAQHPPLYHIMGAFLLKVVSIFTQDSYWLFHTPRLLSVLFATGTLLIIFLVIREYTKDDLFALTCSALVSFIPMYSHMASGTNHDMALVFFSSLSILFLYRFFLNRLDKDAYLSALFIGLAGAVKYSAFLLAVPILLIIFLYLRDDWITKIRKMICICLIGGVFPSLYLIRNWLIFGNPFIIANSLGNTVQMKSVGFIEYLRINPVIDHLFKNFFALIGWNGVGRGELLWFQINGVFFVLLCFVVLGILSLSYWWYLSERIHTGRKSDVIFMISAILALGVIFFCIFFDKGYPLPQKILYSLILAIPFFSLVILRERNENNKFQYLSLAIILFYFIGIVSAFLIPMYEQHGIMRATHGRYFFPLLPLLLISYVYPAYKLVRPPNWVMLVIVILAAIFEFSFYVFDVIPFYQGVIL